MGDVFTALDWVGGALFAGALAMTALSSKEITAAKIMIWCALVFAIARWGTWAMITDQPWYFRAFVGAIIGGFLLAAIPAAFSWINGRSNDGEAQAQPTLPHAPQTVSGSGNAVVGGNNSGTVIGTQNNNTTVNHPVKVVHSTNEGVLIPANLPTPPLPQIANGHVIPPGALKIFFGRGLAWATHMPHTVLRMAGEPMIMIDRKDGSDELTIPVLRIFDDRNNIIARIDTDGFWVENSTRNKRPDPHTLVVFDHTDTEVLRITFINRETLSITGVFRHAGVPQVVTITPDHMTIGGLTMRSFVLGEAGGADINVGDPPVH